mmetsp:Transcript_56913/g.160630  ORF Transcript_56913/g.160630 Transcript_56913/m.160630 type:complete len:210 (+) Transcript_56913:436-1065(+)
MPMSCGSTPTTAKLRMRPRMGRPMAFAAERRARRTRAAPSETWLAFPAVVLPSFLKAAFSLLRPSIVVALGPSSASTTTSVVFPSLSFTLVDTGTISSLKRPCFWAARAFSCESTASLSCVSREMFHFSATFSDVMPIGTRTVCAVALAKMLGESFSGSMSVAMGYMDMDSTPPAMPTSMMPDRMLAAISATACKPLLHCLFTVLRGTS